MSNVNAVPPPPHNSWSEDRLRQFTALVESGMPGPAIAREMGISYNAVIGKAHRLGVKLIKAAPARGGGRPKKPDKVKRALPLLSALVRAAQVNTDARERAVARQVEEAPPEPSAEVGCQFDELSNETCRFPVGDPGTAGFYFCGHPSADLNAGFPYCHHHHARAFCGVRRAQMTPGYTSRTW